MIHQSDFGIPFRKKRRDTAAKGIPENDKLFVRFTVRILDGYQGAGAGKKDLIRIFAGFFLHIVDGTHRLILMIGHDTAI